MIVQLDPQIPMYTPRGFGYALFLNYPSVELGCWWCVAISDTQELWWTPNEEVRVERNWSLWRRGGVGGNEILPVPGVSGGAGVAGVGAGVGPAV